MCEESDLAKVKMSIAQAEIEIKNCDIPEAQIHLLKAVQFLQKFSEDVLLFDEGWLSMRHPSYFLYEDKEYVSAYHYIAAIKAKAFDDPKAYANICRAKTEKTQVKWEKKVRVADENAWITERQGHIYRANWEKFTQNEELKAKLMDTGHRLLAYAVVEDQVLGIGLTADNPLSREPTQWRGLNLLGRSLMEVRESIQRSQSIQQ